MATLAPLLVAADLAALADRVLALPPGFDLRPGDDLLIPPALWDGAPPRARVAVADACAIRNVRAHVAPVPFLARVRGDPA